MSALHWLLAGFAVWGAMALLAALTLGWIIQRTGHRDPFRTRRHGIADDAPGMSARKTRAASARSASVVASPGDRNRGDPRDDGS
ncbi:hypothetical protein [Lichenicoccus roseus]|uniref:Uncharacterized protein n=1 Tax=Lichenicoccus roseus TaxID=2683649 RepID=A0A5R9J564_9PROT|nr:hypothetical protein [Lichenicoccus roseus]TLU72770.1 hypothetical protein FE263_12175 [Lichenicoccus roseus]